MKRRETGLTSLRRSPDAQFLHPELFEHDLSRGLFQVLQQWQEVTLVREVTCEVGEKIRTHIDR